MENPNIWNTPIKTALPGYWYGSLYYVGLYGNYWSSVVLDSYSAYYLTAYDNGSVFPSYYANRYLGYNVRCVAR